MYEKVSEIAVEKGESCFKGPKVLLDGIFLQLKFLEILHKKSI